LSNIRNARRFQVLDPGPSNISPLWGFESHTGVSIRAANQVDLRGLHDTVELGSGCCDWICPDDSESVFSGYLSCCGSGAGVGITFERGD
jgi:hypothetical protein